MNWFAKSLGVSLSKAIPVSSKIESQIDLISGTTSAISNSPSLKLEHSLKQPSLNSVIEEGYIEKNSEYADRVLNVSNEILIYDLIKNSKIESSKVDETKIVGENN